MRPDEIANTLRIRAEIGRRRDGHEMVAAGIDPMVDNHGRELFGVVADPDETPAEARYVAPKRVSLEWIGQQSPLQSEIVLALKARGLLSAFHISILEQAALKCTVRVDGLTSQTLGPRDGLSETIRWGHLRGTFIREVSMRDAEKILASVAGNQFRVVGDETSEATFPPDDAWKPVMAFLRKASKARGVPPPPSNDEAARIRVAIGHEERLAGLGARSNTMGYWQ